MDKTTISNINYYQKILDKSNELSITQRQFYQNVINSIKNKNGKITDKQKIVLNRLVTGNTKYSTKNEVKINNPNITPKMLDDLDNEIMQNKAFWYIESEWREINKEHGYDFIDYWDVYIKKLPKFELISFYKDLETLNNKLKKINQQVQENNQTTMKKSELKEIISNIIDKILNENNPKEAPTKPAPETLPRPDTDTPKPKRRTLQPPTEAPDTKPKAKIKENDKEIVNKITQRFKKLSND